MSIADEVARLRAERPKPAPPALDDTLVDLIESILSADTALSVPVAVDEYMKALNAHIDRRVAAYLRTVEVGL